MSDTPLPEHPVIHGNSGFKDILSINPEPGAIHGNSGFKDILSINHWIFDMDGTLTVAMHDFDAIRGQLGLPAGKPILESLAALEPGAAAPLHAELNRIELDLARQARAAPGATALLENLKSRGARRGILTRNNRENVSETLKAAGLEHFFSDDEIVTRDDAPPKPDPEGLLLLLEQWTAAPGDTLMVGDYVFDLQAGRAAGVRTVYVDPTGEFPFQEHADVKVRALHEL